MEGKKMMSFSETCNLLSQYLKVKGSIAELGLCFEKKQKMDAPKGTLNLLPMIEKSGQNSVRMNSDTHGAGQHDFSIKKPEPKSSPLTIFYGGQVIVFNNFPPEKASEIMSLAGTASQGQYQHFPSFPLPVVSPQSPAESATSFSQTIPTGIISQSALTSDLPIARKNSLSRFLEKRRDRIIKNDPYPMRKPAAAPPLKVAKIEESWLGLGQT